MENNSIKDSVNIQTPQSVPHTQDHEDYMKSTDLVPSVHKSRWLILVLISLLVLTLVTTAFFAYQNMQLKKQPKSITNVTVSPSPTPQPPLPSSSPTNQMTATNNFTYQNFTLTYPSDWIFSDMTNSNNFPLRERLQQVYEQGKVVALSKDGTHLIITIENATEGGAGGIFITDQEYQQFLTDNDSFLIGNSTFYINKSHSDIASLAESHSGPWMWASVAEYIPNKTTESGNTYKGYENIIKRGNYAYNFIVVSNTGGITEDKLQNEIISILETATW